MSHNITNNLLSLVAYDNSMKKYFENISSFSTKIDSNSPGPGPLKGINIPHSSDGFIIKYIELDLGDELVEQQQGEEGTFFIEDYIEYFSFHTNGSLFFKIPGWLLNFFIKFDKTTIHQIGNKIIVPFPWKKYFFGEMYIPQFTSINLNIELKKNAKISLINQEFLYDAEKCDKINSSSFTTPFVQYQYESFQIDPTKTMHSFDFHFMLHSSHLILDVGGDNVKWIESISLAISGMIIIDMDCDYFTLLGNVVDNRYLIVPLNGDLSIDNNDPGNFKGSINFSKMSEIKLEMQTDENFDCDVINIACRNFNLIDIKHGMTDLCFSGVNFIDNNFGIKNKKNISKKYDYHEAVTTDSDDEDISDSENNDPVVIII